MNAMELIAVQKDHDYQEIHPVALKQYAHLGYAPCEMREPAAPDVKPSVRKPAKAEPLTTAAH